MLFVDIQSNIELFHDIISFHAFYVFHDIILPKPHYMVMGLLGLLEEKVLLPSSPQWAKHLNMMRNLYFKRHNKAR